MCNWLFQMAVNMAFEPLLAATSTATTFGVSLVVMVFALGFIHAFLPETRGLEGEEIVTYDICSMQQVQHKSQKALTSLVSSRRLELLPRLSRTLWYLKLLPSLDACCCMSA